MASHTVPRKLLDQFGSDDPCTNPRRLWRYDKDRRLRGRHPLERPRAGTGISLIRRMQRGKPKLETRLEREFEAPVNKFIESIDASFSWNDKEVRL
jgi:hypothetical protein